MAIGLGWMLYSVAEAAGLSYNNSFSTQLNSTQPDTSGNACIHNEQQTKLAYRPVPSWQAAAPGLKGVLLCHLAVCHRPVSLALSACKRISCCPSSSISLLRPARLPCTSTTVTYCTQTLLQTTVVPAGSTVAGSQPGTCRHTGSSLQTCGAIPLSRPEPGVVGAQARERLLILLRQPALCHACAPPAARYSPHMSSYALLGLTSSGC
jgi:hypothetical protein